MSADTPKDIPATLNMAQILLGQGDVWRAEKVYNELLAREPINPQARAGLARCRALMGRGEENMSEKKLATLRLLLARLTGQPVVSSVAAAEAPAPTAAVDATADPRARKLHLLRALLEKVQAWKAQAGWPR